jgi:homogentisate 1,2-dioxygenase
MFQSQLLHSPFDVVAWHGKVHNTVTIKWHFTPLHDVDILTHCSFTFAPQKTWCQK